MQGLQGRGCLAQSRLSRGPCGCLGVGRGTVGRGEVSLRRSRGIRLCGTLGATVRNLAFTPSEMGSGDGFKQRTHMF